MARRGSRTVRSASRHSTGNRAGARRASICHLPRRDPSRDGTTATDFNGRVARSERRRRSKGGRSGPGLPRRDPPARGRAGRVFEARPDACVVLMPLVSLDHISMAYGHLPLLDDASLQIEAGERVCVIGRNGTGKSTLLQIIAGEISPDAGTTWRQPGIRDRPAGAGRPLVGRPPGVRRVVADGFNDAPHLDVRATSLESGLYVRGVVARA